MNNKHSMIIFYFVSFLSLHFNTTLFSLLKNVITRIVLYDIPAKFSKKILGISLYQV